MPFFARRTLSTPRTARGPEGGSASPFPLMASEEGAMLTPAGHVGSLGLGGTGQPPLGDTGINPE